ncbi:MAG: hypothetical protein AAF628_34205 [Planctomycetota bacterium]
MNFQSVSSLAAATLGLWMASSLASQGIHLPPSDLNPGAPYRVLFVTDSTRDATSADIAEYDAFVAADANAVSELAALSTNWRAVASTPTVDARDHTDTVPSTAGGTGVGVPIYRPDGTRIAATYDRLWGSSRQALRAAPQVTASGDLVDSLVWTGTKSDGSAAEPLGFESYSRAGLTDHTVYWVWVNDEREHQQFPLYGMSDVLTVPGPFEGYGSACGFAVLASGSPELGSSYTLRSPVFPSPSPGIGAIFLGATQLALDLTALGLPGCQLLTSSEAIVPMQVVSVRPPPFSISHFELTLPVPSQPSLVGMKLYHQGVHVDSASRIALSQGIAVTYFD